MLWLTFVSLACWFFCIILYTKNRQALLCYSFICLLLMMTAGLRNMGGSDYFVYEYDYLGIQSYDGNGLKAVSEGGYTSLVYVCNYLNLSYNEFILIYSLIVLIPLSKLYWKISPYPFLSILLYFSTFFMYYNMIALRQMLPMLLMLYAIYNLSREKYVKFILIVLGGSLFHNSFLILFPTSIFICLFKPTKKNLLLLLAFTIVIKGSVISFIENIIMSSGSMEVALRMKELTGGSGNFSMAFYLRTLILSLFIIGYRNKIESRFYQLQFNCFLVGLVLACLFTGNLMIFRLTAYFDLSITFLIPYLFYRLHLSYKNRKICFFLIASVYISMFYRTLQLHDDGAFFNYKFYFL